MTNLKQPLIIISGPTSAGKTALSLKLAKTVGGEIISADSMQVYRHMDIGTAKIKPSEMQGVPHYLVDCLNPDSLEVLTGCKVERSLADCVPTDRFQFLRLGYFAPDSKDSSPGHPVFNRAVALKDSFKK